jgi:hypothetical protein
MPKKISLTTGGSAKRKGEKTKNKSLSPLSFSDSRIGLFRIMVFPKSQLRSLSPVAPAVSAESASTAAAVVPSGTPLVGFGAGFIYRNGLPQKLAAVEFLDGFLGVFLGFHLHKAEAPAKPGVFVLDDIDGNDFSDLGKIRFQVLFGDFIR